MKKKLTWKHILMLQGIVAIYTVSGVMAKFAVSGETTLQVLFYYGLQLASLGIYAILWQQMIQRFDLSVAYANRAMALLWSAVWAITIFGESVGPKQILGIVLVIAGTVIINTEKKEEHHG